MKFIFTVVVLFSLQLNLFPQDATKIAVIHGSSYNLVDAENQSGIIYVSLFDFLRAIPIPFSEEGTGTAAIIFESRKLQIKSNNPFISINDLKDSSISTFQMSGSTYTKNSKMFISLNSIIELINRYWVKELVPLAANRVKILEKVGDLNKTGLGKSVKISSVEIEYGSESISLRIKTNGKVDNFYNYYRSQNLHLILWNTTISNDTSFLPKSNEIVEKIEISNAPQFLEFKLILNEKETITEVYEGKDVNELVLKISKRDFKGLVQ